MSNRIPVEVYEKILEGYLLEIKTCYWGLCTIALCLNAATEISDTEYDDFVSELFSDFPNVLHGDYVWRVTDSESRINYLKQKIASYGEQ